MDQATSPTAANALQVLIGNLQDESYTRLESFCTVIKQHISAVRGEDDGETLAFYLALSEKLINSVEQYLRLRHFALIPYVQELLGKDQEGHDCRACDKSCSIRHTQQTVTICEAHQRIKEILYRLQTIALPIYNNAAAPRAYNALRNQVMEMDRLLTQTFYLEESKLIPLIQGVQKQIYAHG